MTATPRRLLPILALALAPLAAAAQEAPPTPLPRTITVVGEGRTDAKPDLAVVSLGVSHQAETAGEAMAMMAEGMTAVLAVMAEAGVAPADVQTGQLTLEGAYDYNSSSSYPPVVGFIATQVVDVRVREVASLGDVIDAVTAEGANRINGVSFTLDDPSAALGDARAAAVADAQAKAEFLANAAGVALGELIAIDETGGFGPPQPLYDARFAAEAAATPIAPGQVSLTATVSMTYAIE